MKECYAVKDIEIDDLLIDLVVDWRDRTYHIDRCVVARTKRAAWPTAAQEREAVLIAFADHDHETT